MNKSLLIADNLVRLFLGYVYKWQQNALYALLDNDCSIRVYHHLLQFFKIFPIMLILCLALSVIYYAQA